MPELVEDLSLLQARAAALVRCGARRLLGITGPPGAGKSTLAAALADGLGTAAVVVPMDGFHLAQAELVHLGRAARKGAPDTFDAAGYVALLRRLREGAELVSAPAFDRDLEEPVAGAIAVEPQVALVITEGNYLLLDGPWASVREVCDEIWYVELPEEERVARLVARHAAHGKSPAAARAWAEGSDAVNAVVVAATRDRAGLLVRQSAGQRRPASGQSIAASVTNP